ncbi:MAG: DUF4347 domain-containing protein, partial [Gammaproteobacteria bacterium]|nr:DUF4347 domain-containing protein [Gammaproteobacteria bacterium]
MTGKLAKKQSKRLHYEELEQRVLLSADLAPGFEYGAVEEQVLVEESAHEVQIKSEVVEDLVNPAAVEIRSELVILNENVADHEQLISDLKDNNNNRRIEVVILDADDDGIEQVSEILSERSDLTAIHFISHGSEGQINLGNTWLDSSTLQQNSDALAGWGSALTQSGDILFYGCNIAADSDGQILLSNIADLTGADVSASDDLTGHQNLGGDWDLEVQVGDIESGQLIVQQAQERWMNVLLPPTAADNTITTHEDTTYTFAANDFGYSDPEDDAMVSVQITTLETNGALQLNGADVTLNQVITKAD